MIHLDSKRSKRDRLDLMLGKRYVVIEMTDEGLLSYTIGLESETTFLAYASRVLSLVADTAIADELGDEIL